uniref:Uncharacterized protein n=1 Tax=Meloidogyne enterolobii TaxID=390850 RepID=A0A6V7X3G9_MELEN|nr:unnamed protein product [Meloidogyne enterolobii]
MLGLLKSPKFLYIILLMELLLIKSNMSFIYPNQNALINNENKIDSQIEKTRVRRGYLKAAAVGAAMGAAAFAVKKTFFKNKNKNKYYNNGK